MKTRMLPPFVVRQNTLETFTLNNHARTRVRITACPFSVADQLILIGWGGPNVRVNSNQPVELTIAAGPFQAQGYTAGSGTMLVEVFEPCGCDDKGK